jgi:hypothetical protein
LPLTPREYFYVGSGCGFKYESSRVSALEIYEVGMQEYEKFGNEQRLVDMATLLTQFYGEEELTPVFKAALENPSDDVELIVEVASMIRDLKISERLYYVKAFLDHPSEVVSEAARELIEYGEGNLMLSGEI